MDREQTWPKKRKGTTHVSTLAMTDAMIKLLIRKGIFTDAEFKAELNTERATYLAVLKRLH